MSTEEKITYCRICEPLCGMVATVEDGRVTKLRPDKQHPLSAGFACPKGIAMTEVQNDPDRILHPQRRLPDGSFERVSWDQALAEIGERLGAIRDEHGGESVGWYMGNPGAFSYSHPLWVKGFIDGLGSQHYYTASSQDVSNRFAASSLLYGSPFLLPIPDLERTDLLLVVGANPLVSHGSVMSAPRIKDQLHAITARGGRVVVVDPRRSETAREFEHVALHPDSDAWLLLSLLNVVFAEGLQDAAAIALRADGGDDLRRLVEPHDPEATEARTGVGAERVRELARDLAAADGAAIYGRTGSCLGRHGTLVSFLLDALALVTGNLDEVGGSMFGDPAIPFDRVAEAIGADSYGERRSRVGDLPEVLGAMPASLMAKEITTPGPGRMRALFVSAGNPVLSVPDGEELTAALGELDLCVAIDIYMSDTARHADYVLPATTFLEREDYPLPFLGLFTKPYINMTEAVVEPSGEARQEWEIVEEIASRVGRRPVERARPAAARANRDQALAAPARRHAAPHRPARRPLRPAPRRPQLEASAGGAARDRPRRPPRGGRAGAEGPPRGRAGPALPARDRGGGRLARRGGRRRRRRVPAADDRAARAALAQLLDAQLAEADGRRPRRIAPGSTPTTPRPPGSPTASGCGSRPPTARSRPSPLLSDEVIAGTIAVPHGWGHDGGWRIANAAGGANTNALASSEPDDLERLAGMAHLNGIAVRIAPVGASGEARRSVAATA